MQKLVFTNGGGASIDLTSVSSGGYFGITNWEGLSGVGLNIQTQQVPFQDGGVFLDALMEQREISVTVAIQDNNDLSARYERKRELVSALNPKLGEGVLVYTNDYLSRQIKAVPQLPIFENKNSNDSGTLKASVTFSCPSPYWEDLEDTVVIIDETDIKQIENKGDAPIGVQIEIETANVTNPKITNLTTTKKIEYNGLTNTPILIDTRAGKKSAEQMTYDYSLLLEKVTWNTVDYIPRLNILLFATSEGLLYGNDIYNLQINYLPQRDIYGIAHNDNIIIAVGGNGIYSSTDAKSWQLRQQGNFTNVKYSTQKNCFIAISNNGEIYKSTDGITFVQKVTVPTSGVEHQSVCEFNNYFWIPTNSVLYKYDGETTITQALEGTIFNITTDENSIIVFGHFFEGFIKQSVDGVNFTNIGSNLELENSYLGDIVYNNNLHTYIIFAEKAGTGDVYTIVETYKSEDLITWNKIDEKQNTEILALVYIQETLYTYIAGSMLEESLDLVTWYSKDRFELGDGNGEIKYKYGKLLLGCDGFIAVEENNTYRKVLEQTGVLFSKFTEHLSTLYVEGYISGASELWSTKNGENWEKKNYTFGYIGDMSADNNLLLILDVINEKFIKTYDGESFIEDVTSINLNGAKIAGGENYFLMASGDTNYNTNKIYKINEDLTTELLYTFSENVTSISYHKKTQTFVVLSNQEIYISKDGNSWKKVAENIIGTKIVYEPISAIIYVLSTSKYYISYNLYNWEERNVYLYFYPNSVTYDYKNNTTYIRGGNTVIIEELAKQQNVIANLTNTSDMSFAIERGINKIRLNKEQGSFRARVIFRQKYIGV